MKGKYIVDIIRNGEVIDSFEVENLITKEGKAYLLKVGFTGAPPIANWYVGLKGSMINVSENDTAQTALGSNGTYAELTSYTSTTRVPYQSQWDNTINILTNQANVAIFEASADMTVNGFFIVSSGTKNSNTGILFSAVNFTNPKNLAQGDSLAIRYDVTI
ncbi:MAG: hypothetical protein QXW35_03615 [Candidatus Aenigmatarchaeota archaeon]